MLHRIQRCANIFRSHCTYLHLSKRIELSLCIWCTEIIQATWVTKQLRRRVKDTVLWEHRVYLVASRPIDSTCLARERAYASTPRSSVVKRCKECFACVAPKGHDSTRLHMFLAETNYPRNDEQRYAWTVWHARLSIETTRKSLQKFDRLLALGRTFVTFSLTDYHGSIGNAGNILCDAYNRQREEGQRVVERDDERRRGKLVEKSKFREWICGSSSPDGRQRAAGEDEEGPGSPDGDLALSK